jgi:hypothetical protein
VSVILESVVDAVWQEVSSIPESRIPVEMGRAAREQPELLSFILGSTEGMGPGVSELAGFIYFVIWRTFRGETRGKMRVVTAGAIQRKLEQNETDLARLDGTDPQAIDAALIEKITSQPALFGYMIEAITAAEEDENEPVVISAEEKGSLVLLLKTAIDVLDDVRRAA